MSSIPKTPFIYYRTPAPAPAPGPLWSESELPQAPCPIRKGTKLPPPPFSPSKEESLFDPNWRPPKGSHPVNPYAYFKALERAYGFLRLPSTLLTEDGLKKDYAHALSMKNALAGGLADAEQLCHVSESALHQALGETEVQKISSENIAVGVDEARAVRRQYMAAITSIRMQDLPLSTNGQVATVVSSNSPRAAHL